ncbi:enolase C-terminal domain-like protein [Pandoraea apista]|uniref:Mandelate racemase n=1 Tax=Pandoraea apista TaxID=93218 RepID=A0ABX9ZJR8_9BURK|nr:enolase C-terminal domain-like protein [Pandoraea apista]ALS67990.1 mandelate racemase [Pandoraea apista]PTD98574.1 mandelate racemase [Pandoraea apista]RRJ27653.1 mandelate racemase [Pandoraea apista]RRJ73103.1 mandelate racemase [Pandoraea apista]RRW89729.1 mandelate racemase [Pandoraea apista]
MRIVDVRELTIPISRYADRAIPSGGLTTSLVAIVTDVIRSGKPVVGYGFASIGRFGQGGLIRERFAPRLIAAGTLANDTGDGLDPLRAWSAMMQGEKPGGHGERCVAVGTLDMAVWDAAAKIAGQPLYRCLSEHLSGQAPPSRVRVYAGGGYRYPEDDLLRLADEIRHFTDLGLTHAKIKIGGDLDQDLVRIDTAVAKLAGPSHLAVDGMNTYGHDSAMRTAHALAPLGLAWFEDICDPLDFKTLSRVAASYAPPIAAGEALFSRAEARLLDAYGGLRRHQDILLFDPTHCYGLTHYCEIVAEMTHRGWPRSAFWPHGGHLFGLHVVAGLRLGGAEINPLAFAPFQGMPSGLTISDGFIDLPQAPGIGFESHDETHRAFRRLMD